MKRIFNNHFRLPNDQRGAVLIIFALLLLALIGFTALGMEAGRWYAVRAELSKAVDAAALAGAKNISNPYVTLEGKDGLVSQVGRENFSPGYLISKEDSLSFTTTRPDNKKVKVEGRVDAIVLLARVLGIDLVASSSSGVGEKNKVEIMLVLDRSGSMSGTPLAKLKEAAKNFVDFFEETQDEDKIGLITYATGVKVSQPLGINFIDNGIKIKIDAMTIPSSGDRDTNIEDALDQCDDDTDRNGSLTTTLTDQSGLPGDQRVQQYVIFFSDGRATAFRGNYINGMGDTVILKFKRDGIEYDAVVPDPGDVDKNYLGHPWSGEHLGASVKCLPTGDGKPTATTTCKACPYCPSYLNTRWGVFERYPLSGHGVEDCKIGGSSYMGSNPTMKNYVMATARQMAIDHAGVLKDKYIKIYSIGLGSVDQGLLQSIASEPVGDYYYYAPTPSDLDAIFKKIAKEIKLRLVQ